MAKQGVPVAGAYPLCAKAWHSRHSSSLRSLARPYVLHREVERPDQVWSADVPISQCSAARS